MAHAHHRPNRIGLWGIPPARMDPWVPQSRLPCLNSCTLNELARLLQEGIPIVVSAQRHQYRLRELRVATVAPREKIAQEAAMADEEPMLLDELD